MQRIEIRVKGEIDEHWSDWFDDLTITHNEKGETIFSGVFMDQTRLYSLLAKLRDLGVSLISVNIYSQTSDR
jgi:hypothetical protein